jgi:stage III sporulation protein AG
MGGVKDVRERYAKLWGKLKKGGWAAAVLIVGFALFLLPGGKSGQSEDGGEADASLAVEFSLREQENRMSETLSEIEGAGRVRVMLTLSAGTEQILQKDTAGSSKGADGAGGESEHSESTVIISRGGSVQSAVAAKYLYPKYQGALVVADGAGRAEIRLELMRAISGLTGLGADKITVSKMKSA